MPTREKVALSFPTVQYAGTKIIRRHSIMNLKNKSYVYLFFFKKKPTADEENGKRNGRALLQIEPVKVLQYVV